MSRRLPHNSFCRFTASRFGGILSVIAFLFGAFLPAEVTLAAAPATNTVTIEAFVRQDSEQCTRALEFLNELADRRSGIDLRVYDVIQDKQALGRVWQLARRFKRDKAGAPTIYLCDRIVVGFRDAETTGRVIEDMLTIHAYLREGCSKCRAAKEYLAGLQQRWPAVRVAQYDVIRDPNAQRRMLEIAAQYQVRTPVVPAFHLAGRFLVGWRGMAITGEQVEAVFRNSLPPLEPKASPPTTDTSRAPSTTSRELRRSLSEWARLIPYQQYCGLMGSLALAMLQNDSARAPPIDTNQEIPGDRVSADGQRPTQEASDETFVDEVPVEADEPAADELPLFDELPIVDEVPEAAPGTDLSAPCEPSSPQSIELPFFGIASVSELGLPLFTFLVGLVDGFNPCAMWVLVFLLSILVNIKDRKKILLIAGSFVLVSGLAYFAFMAAWLNVFQLIGLQRWVQIALGSLGVVIGLINVKDFFAFRRGITLSIPESAKPGIYRRVRRIVTTEVHDGGNRRSR